jgi:threonine synthase
MDIQIPSNLERLLWYVSGMDSEAIADLMHRHSQTGDVTVPDEWMGEIRSQFIADRVSDQETLATIKHTRDEFGLTIDPHTATAMCVANNRSHSGRPGAGSIDLVVETAAPDKFLDAVEQALGERPELHPQLEALLNMPERSTSIQATFEALDSAIRGLV